MGSEGPPKVGVVEGSAEADGVSCIDYTDEFRGMGLESRNDALQS